MNIIAKIVYVIVAAVLFIGPVACEPVSGGVPSPPAASHPEEQEQQNPEPEAPESDFKCGNNPNHIFILEIDMTTNASLRACTPEDEPVSGKNRIC